MAGSEETAQSNFHAFFGVYQNVSNLSKQIATYAHIGFVVDGQ